ncbi:diguanylate cyclase (GGDEF)-like protein [Desulfobotulus alkaliphilus]|uniref:Diguanylate cyclase (GGDEF)-like protein n=1 Tax=Desulfobotulus alkaliphilus TaxID=622671 RepID=A0A562RJN3_9BACT|nr:EAL domain-containing protein [Desulfobotulus alkaliphilus]TWI68590.1 diguanylate cyclase (GGDEF)-like protein [Desulfobotulus alkaliphilus]
MDFEYGEKKPDTDGTAAPKILIVDDEEVNRVILDILLSKKNFITLSAASGEECIQKAEEEAPDLILLDIMMPVMDGFRTCEILKANPRTREIPVIFLSTLADSRNKATGIEIGGVDYLSKPFDGAELMARLRLHLTLRSQKKQLRRHTEILEETVRERTRELSRAERALRHSYEQQGILNHLLQLSLKDQSLEEILQQCLESILKISWLRLQHRGCIFLAGRRDGTLQRVAHQPCSDAIRAALSEKTGIGISLCPQKACIADIHASSDFPSDLTQHQMHILVPVWSRSRPLALLCLHLENTQALSPEKKNFLTSIAGTLMQIILHRQAEEQARHNLLHDSLTGLPNRTFLIQRLKTESLAAKETPESCFGLALLSLDHFRNFNESFGFSLGDGIIHATAEKLLEEKGSDYEVWHLGADTFALLFSRLKNRETAIRSTEKILEGIRIPFSVKGHLLHLTASAGIAFSDFSYKKSSEILRDADTAIHQARILGRDRLMVFTPKMHEKARGAMETLMDLRQAMEKDELILFYQPIIHVDSGKVTGVEALIRWKHPHRGMVSPAEFIPIAEETGLILSMGKWILKKACTDIKAFNALYPNNPLTLSVNLSSKEFANTTLFEQIRQTLTETGFPPERLKLEITESVVMGNAEAAVITLSKLKEINVRISIDDFGTGYSSLSYLHRFPADSLKIDRSFIRRMHLGGENMEIVRTIVTLGKALHMEITAEGVETAEELAMVKELDCPCVQGFYFARPMPLEELKTSRFFHPLLKG